jgi:hypothetical protein
MKPFLRKISNYAIVGSLGAVVVLNLVGCNSKEDDGKNGEMNHLEEISQQKKGATVVIKEVAPKEYKIVSETPSDETTIILEELNGNKRILSKEELDELVKQADKKIENGTSPLTNPEASSSNGGLSLGETILASAAGAIVGSWIGSKLFNNQNYQHARERSYSSPSVMQRSKDSFRKNHSTGFGGKSLSSSNSKHLSSSTSSTRKSGFFKSGYSSSSSHSSSYFSRGG